jgi:hypothetical protein
MVSMGMVFRLVNYLIVDTLEFQGGVGFRMSRGQNPRNRCYCWRVQVSFKVRVPRFFPRLFQTGQSEHRRRKWSWSVSVAVRGVGTLLRLPK